MLLGRLYSDLYKLLIYGGLLRTYILYRDIDGLYIRNVSLYLMRTLSDLRVKRLLPDKCARIRDRTRLDVRLLII